MNKNTDEQGPKLRQYDRLKNVTPVEYSIVRLQGDLPGIDWQKGHTLNVSKEGMCLETEQMNEATINYLGKENILLELRIHLPVSIQPIKAVGEVAWFTKKTERCFIIGLKYRSITPENQKKILKETKLKLKLSKLALMLGIATSIILVLAIFISKRYL